MFSLSIHFALFTESKQDQQETTLQILRRRRQVHIDRATLVSLRHGNIDDNFIQLQCTTYANRRSHLTDSGGQGQPSQRETDNNNKDASDVDGRGRVPNCQQRRRRQRLRQWWRATATVSTGKGELSTSNDAGDGHQQQCQQ